MAKLNLFVYHSGNTGYVKNIVRALSELATIHNQPSEKCDAFLSLQMGAYSDLIAIKKLFTNKPLITYVWDCYGWIFQHGRGYDWHSYGELCKVSDEVWVPSHGQTLRLKQHWGIEHSRVIKCYAQFFDYDGVKDGNYVCNPLREIPDRQLGWIERACEELNIPYKNSGRGRGSTGRSWEEYKKFIAESSFIVCPYYEASTGGMSLLEGYNLGKEILICNTPYLGAKDYFGDRAFYFEPSYESLKQQVRDLWFSRSHFPVRTIDDKKQFCKEFTVNAFAERIVAELSKLIK